MHVDTHMDVHVGKPVDVHMGMHVDVDVHARGRNKAVPLSAYGHAQMTR